MQLERLCHLGGQIEVGHRVAQQPTDEEFEAQVINPLVFRLVRTSGRRNPGIDDIIPQGVNSGVVPIVRLGGVFVFAHAVAQYPYDPLVHGVPFALDSGSRGGRPWLQNLRTRPARTDQPDPVG